MAEEVLTPEIKRFLREHVASLEHLEILLLLCGASEKQWTAAGVYDVIKSSRESVIKVLGYWRDAGFIAEEGPERFQYRPATDALRDLTTKVAAIYKTHRIRVIEFVYTAPTDPLSEFSRAFRLRREK